MSWRRPRTLRGRLALWYAGAVSAVLIAFSATVYFVVADQEEPGKLTLAPGEPPDLSPRRLMVALALALPVALGVAVGGGWWISRRALAPLDDVVRIAGGLGADNLTARIPTQAGAADEIERLVSSLNAMLARLEHAVDGMRRFTADASHELRTPMAVLMGEIELTLRRPRDPDQLRSSLEGTLEELGRLSRLVESLLTLARSDNGELPLERISLDAVALARQVLEPYDALMSARQLTLSFVGDAPVWVTADPLWLGRALANLVDNACKFTPAGGQIAVSVHSTTGAAEIVVRDSGPGLVVAERERVFERFFRSASVRGSTDGFGLGLALAREIVRGLGGELSAVEPDGAGAAFRVRLPQGAGGFTTTSRPPAESAT